MSDARSVTIRGNPFPLAGNEVKVGDKAPDVQLIGIDSQPRNLSEFSGKVRILSSVPSLDTAVCDTETRRFNQIATELSDDVEVITISVDLPMAQKRWCGAAGVDRVTLLSDHRETAFGLNYGVLIPAVRLLARCVFVVDQDDVIRYIQLVPEIGQEPDYDEVIQAVKELL
ncbi:MAG: thiol peroxidase [Methanobacteriota archaeon]|nr:MAG: thiol peroxidase [Euryarchaeota archaeon]